MSDKYEIPKEIRKYFLEKIKVSTAGLKWKPKLIKKGFELIEENQRKDWEDMVDTSCRSLTQGKEVSAALKIMQEIKNGESVEKVAYLMNKDIYLQNYVKILIKFVPNNEEYFHHYFVRYAPQSERIFNIYAQNQRAIQQQKNQDFGK